jgi:hypothetical protein
VRVEIEAHDTEAVGVLAIEEAVPGVTGSSGLEEPGAVGGAAEHLERAQMVREDKVGSGKGVSGGGRVGVEGSVTHDGKAVVVVLDVELEGDADLAEVAKAGGGAARFLGLLHSWKEEAGEDGDHRKDDQQFEECEGVACRAAEILERSGCAEGWPG